MRFSSEGSRSFNNVYFRAYGMGVEEGVHIRRALASRLLNTWSWEWQCRNQSASITTRLGPAVASVFFNDFTSLEPAKCYLVEKGVDRLEPFLPVIGEVAEKGRFLFVAIAFLNLIEVSPRVQHLTLVAAVAKAWFDGNPDRRDFWMENGIGRRVCALISKTIPENADLVTVFGEERLADLRAVVASLIRLGLPEASDLENLLRQQSR